MGAARAPAEEIPRELRTERLWLRRWRPEDREPFAALNGDARVMEYFQGTLSPQRSDAMASHIEDSFARHGFGLWAVEIPGVTSFAGFIGLSVPGFAASFTPCVEIGWRLAIEHWGRGYAPEGARAVLDFGFTHARLDEILSFTAVSNLRSRRVMEKIGMTRSAADDFDHPSVPEGHWLRRHVLYRARRSRPA